MCMYVCWGRVRGAPTGDLLQWRNYFTLNSSRAASPGAMLLARQFTTPHPPHKVSRANHLSSPPILGCRARMPPPRFHRGDFSDGLREIPRTAPSSPRVQHGRCTLTDPRFGGIGLARTVGHTPVKNAKLAGMPAPHPEAPPGSTGFTGAPAVYPP